ncbi:MAG: hypothetical protein K8T26_06130 [Lentisphaerae bacterium]|nr:hypothetical protein [Lentisphaerota bacterium]
MNEGKLQTPQQAATRTTLRRAGLAMLALGGLLTLIGIGSFFASFGSFGAPRLFWCAFLGMPLLFVGGAMTLFGFMGAVQRYVAGESAPVAKDVVNYMGENIQPGVKSIAKAVTEGVKEGLNGEQKNQGT